MKGIHLQNNFIYLIDGNKIEKKEKDILSSFLVQMEESDLFEYKKGWYPNFVGYVNINLNNENIHLFSFPKGYESSSLEQKKEHQKLILKSITKANK